MENLLTSRRGRGNTLIETVIALFILAGGLATVAALYASTANGQGKDIESLNILRLAQSRIGELRAQATDIVEFGSLGSESGVVTPAGFPNLRVDTRVQDATVPYPCTGLRETIDFTTSYKRATVRVLDLNGNELIKLVSLIGEPAVEIDRLVVEVEPGPDPIPRDVNRNFRAALIDVDGNEINDLLFRFYGGFRDGYGTLNELPDGQRVGFTNAIINPTGPNIYTGGTISIVSRAFYAGQEFRGESALVTLSP